MTRDDGGPAFPLPFILDRDRPGQLPQYVDAEDAGAPTGMSLRDWFAGQALAAVTSMMRNNTPLYPESIASASYAIADAMLKARGEV